MSDGRANNGGRRENAGRKTKAEELGLIPLIDECWPIATRKKWLKGLASLSENPKTAQGMEAGKILAYFFYGMPTRRVELSGNDGKAIETIITVHYADTPPPASSATGDQG